MPSYEIHHETYHPNEGIPIVEAVSAYEAVMRYALTNYAPCKVRRLEPDNPGDKFIVQPTDATSDDNGIVLEVFDYEGEPC